jgi:hypothetical protein
MAAITTPDGLLARISNQYNKQDFSFFNSTAKTAVLASSTVGQRHLMFRDIPTLESGVTSYIPTELYVQTSVNTGYLLLFGELIDLGSLDISTNTFTDGNAMPTRTVFNTSTALSSPIIMEVEVALNATPGSIAVTYVDEDGNTAETTTAQAMTASSTVGSFAVITLNTGDYAARDITGAARSGGTTPTGTVRFWGIVPIVFVATGNGSTSNGVAYDLINNGIVRRLPTGAKIAGFVNHTATGATLGMINYVGDA